jgi:hypothetical protein
MKYEMNFLLIFFNFLHLYIAIYTKRVLNFLHLYVYFTFYFNYYFILKLILFNYISQRIPVYP